MGFFDLWDTKTIITVLHDVVTGFHNLATEIAFSRRTIMTGIEHLQKSVKQLTDDTAANQEAYLKASAANTAAIKADIQVLVDRAKDGAAAAELDKIAEGVGVSLDKVDAANNEFSANQVKASNDFTTEIDKLVNPPASTTPPATTEPPAETQPA